VVCPFAGVVFEYELIQRYFAKEEQPSMLQLEKPFASKRFIDYAMGVMLGDLEIVAGKDARAAFEHAHRCLTVLEDLKWDVSSHRTNYRHIRDRRGRSTGDTAMLLSSNYSKDNGEEK